MTSKNSQVRNRALIIGGLGIALLIAVFLSPFASSNPDGLDRVSQDLKFEDKAIEDAPAKKLPFYKVFDEYALRGVPKGVATPLAGLIGTLATFGLAWGVGKLVIRRSGSSDDINNSDSSGTSL
ncbi:PDGLE domain-containing protein [Phormidium sp. LEGE 05292]|uniref:PDGLE domain-containing protein n=1 Tax=[Phormidium] sp. LEGE 05292 TaxID=767427 RepID=UPI001882A446|nr:PDGLE domain-containing protein [Phormidium sp. LEGE 05292]MBE9225785.1 PDGLE domain-containing protein [Phormidium sp. LEGE 05292]